MKDPTYGQLSDALRLIREGLLLKHREQNERFDRLFGEQLRPLRDALNEYFAWRDGIPQRPAAARDRDADTPG